MELAYNFWSLLEETSLVLLASYFFAGLAKAYFPEISVSWLAVSGRWAQSIRGLLFAIPLPVCSCGALPIYHSLFTRGVPIAALVTFLIAVPELGLDAAIVSTQLLGSDFTIARIFTAILVAVFSGVMVSRYGKPKPMTFLNLSRFEHGDSGPLATTAKLKEAIRYAFVEMIDHTAVWILLGLSLAALVSTYLNASAFAGLPPGLDVAVMALVGIPGYVCATGSTPFVASLLAKGLSPGAAITFLLTGPATNMTTILVLKKLHGWRTVSILLASITGGSIFFGLVVNASGLVPISAALVPPEIAHSSPSSLLALLPAGLFLTLCGVSLYRQGLRSFFSQIFPEAPVLQPESASLESCTHKNCSH